MTNWLSNEINLFNEEEKRIRSMIVWKRQFDWSIKIDEEEEETYVWRFIRWNWDEFVSIDVTLLPFFVSYSREMLVFRRQLNWTNDCCVWLTSSSRSHGPSLFFRLCTQRRHSYAQQFEEEDTLICLIKRFPFSFSTFGKEHVDNEEEEEEEPNRCQMS